MTFLQSVSHGVYGINSIYKSEKNLLNPVCLKTTRQMAEMRKRGGIKLFVYV